MALLLFHQWIGRGVELLYYNQVIVITSEIQGCTSTLVACASAYPGYKSLLDPPIYKTPHNMKPNPAYRKVSWWVRYSAPLIYVGVDVTCLFRVQASSLAARRFRVGRIIVLIGGIFHGSERKHSRLQAKQRTRRGGEAREIDTSSGTRSLLLVVQFIPDRHHLLRPS